MGQSETLVSVDFTVDDKSLLQEFGEGFLWGLIPGVGAVRNVIRIGQFIGGAVEGFFTTSEKTELAVNHYEAKDYPDVLYLPIYTITAEEIFKGNIAMFDIDFFNPRDVYVKTSFSSPYDKNTWKLTDQGRQYKNSESYYDGLTDDEFVLYLAQRKSFTGNLISPIVDVLVGTMGIGVTDLRMEEISKWDDKMEQQGKEKPWDVDTRELLKKYVKIEHTKLSDLSKEQLNDMDIEYYYYLDDNGQEIRTSMDNTASALSGVISKWYKALRNIALVLMMSILLYIGIRMLLSTVSSDKAKYKQMLVDWLVGMCLLFFMHYIMAFSVTLNNKFIKVINTINDKYYVVTLEDDQEKLLSEGLKEAGYDLISKDGKNIVWSTNLMGKVRIAAEMRHGRVSFIGFALCFAVLVFYTVFFAFTYLKRVIYLAFLTIIAPFVAMTYAIDKVNDGQAQGFNKWLKEYIFNLLIQPLHLLLYTMLVSSVFSFASQNIWYMLVAIGFLIPAEKLLRSLFGFEKASTPGSLAGAAVGASLVSSGLGKLLHKVPNSPHGRGNNDKDKELNEGKNPRINFSGEDFDSTGALMDGSTFKDKDKYEYEDEGGDKGENNQDNKDLENNQENQDKIALDQYNQEGFKQNANGEFFNPYTDEYDANYDPRKDDNYIKKNNLDDPTKAQQNLLDKDKPEEGFLEKNKDKWDEWFENYHSQKVPWKNKKTPRRTKLKRAMKAGARRVFTGKNVRRTLANVGRKGIRMAAGAALAAAAGTIGVAAGVASGDPSNVLQYGMAGIGAGALAGGKAADAVMNTAGAGYDKVKNSETRKAMVEAYHGEEEGYKQKQQEKQIKQWKKNVEYKEQLERTLGEEQAKQMYKQGEIDEYLKNGITEIPDMAAMHQLQEKKIAGNIQEAMAIHEYGERVGGDYNRLRNKDKKEWGETFTEEFQQRGHSKEDSAKATKATFDKIKEYHDIRKVIRTKM